MLMLRDSIVKTLLEHGAFDAAATQLVSDALLFYSIALFAHAAIEILSRGFYVLGDTRTPVALAISSMLANLILAAALVDALELRGLALALSIATIGEALLLFLMLNLRLGGKLWSRALFGSIFKTVLASAVMAQVRIRAARTARGRPTLWGRFLVRDAGLLGQRRGDLRRRLPDSAPPGGVRSVRTRRTCALARSRRTDALISSDHRPRFTIYRSPTAY